jgi:hypothetical protein
MKYSLVSLVFIILLIIIYKRYKEAISYEFEILQVPLSSFHQDILLEKQPLVIGDAIVNIEDFLSIPMKYIYSYRHDIIEYIDKNIDNKHYRINKNRYLVLYNTGDEKNDILIIHPDITHDIRNVNKYYNYSSIKYGDNTRNPITGKTNYDITTIRLNPNQLVILPYKWLYYIPNNTIKEFYLNDFMYEYL